jgi:hypothetical protein
VTTGVEGQKTFGTFKEQFTILQELLSRSVIEGAATPEEYQATMLQLLKATEGLRLKNETALQRLEEQKAYYQAAIKTCSMMGSLILNIVSARTRERLRILEGQKEIDRRKIDEDKDYVKELRAKGNDLEAKVLEEDLLEREQALVSQELLSLGSTKETLMTREAVAKSFDIGSVQAEFASPPDGPRGSRVSMEVNTVSELVNESLKAIPVNELAVIEQSTRTKKKRK